MRPKWPKLAGLAQIICALYFQFFGEFLASKGCPFKNILYGIVSVKLREKANVRNQYNQIPHLTQDTICESEKNTRKRHIQESQKVSPFPAGDHKAASNRQDSMTDTKYKIAIRINKRLI